MVGDPRTKEEGFITYALDHPLSARTIRQKIEKQRQELTAQINEGYAKDWPDYKLRVGQLEGLKLAVQICEDVEMKERR